MRRRQPEVASMTAEEKAISEKEKRERRNKRRRERYAEREKEGSCRDRKDEKATG